MFASRRMQNSIRMQKENPDPMVQTGSEEIIKFRYDTTDSTLDVSYLFTDTNLATARAAYLY